MRLIGTPALACLVLAVAASSSSPAQQTGPTDAKAQKTYAEALQRAKARDPHAALDLFRKADKQDGHHCLNCALQAAEMAFQADDLKQLREQVAEVDTLNAPLAAKSQAHYLLGGCEVRRAQQSHKESDYADADAELRKVIEMNGAEKALATYADGVALAGLHQDDAARRQFQAFLAASRRGSVDFNRAQRFLARPELARARMAPAFALTTMNGDAVSLDELAGKVVLIDFWATWCGPCREALPRIQHIAQQFSGQPLVILSVSLDSNEDKWKEFVAKNRMTWAQYRDGSFEGPLATRFGVRAIPSTFTIDADGVLQDQHVGDASIEGKLKKLVAEANQSAEKRSGGL